MMRLFVSLLIVVNCVQSVTVPAGPLTAVGDAVSTSQPGSVILLSSGTFYGCATVGILLDRNITIRGDNSVIDCSGNGVAFQTTSGCDGSVLESIDIRNATTGVIHATSSCNITVVNVTITGSLYRAINISNGGMELIASTIANNTNTTSYGGGGGVAARGSAALSVHSCSFIGNIASKLGGGLLIEGSAVVNVYDSIFTDNGAFDAGGALFANSLVNLSVLNTTFDSNLAVHGGAAYLSNKMTMFHNDSFVNNNASGSGGAVHFYEYDISMNVSGCVFTNNNAIVEGGAIYQSMRFSSVDVDNCTFSYNSADSGGAISSTGLLFIKSSIITCNYAEFYGAGVYLRFDTVIDDTILSNNTAKFGSALYAHGVQVVRVTSSTIFGNIALNYGSAVNALYGALVLMDTVNISYNSGNAVAYLYNNATLSCVSCVLSKNVGTVFYVYTNASLTLENSTCNYNEGSSFVVAYVSYGSTSYVSNCYIANNVAQANGVYRTSDVGSVTRIVNSYFVNNSMTPGASPSYGAAVWVAGDAMVYMYNCTVRDNVAYDGGGGILVDTRAYIEIHDSIILNNAAVDFRHFGTLGGGVLVRNNATAVLNNCKLINNTASLGGALSIGYRTDVLQSTGKLTITHCMILDNVGIESGGGLFTTGNGTTVLMSDCTVSGNTGGGGGGAYVEYDAVLNITKCNITDNSQYGIYGSDSTVYLDNDTVICSNLPLQYYGGITGYPSLCGTITNVIFDIDVYDNTLYPGTVLTVDGVDMLADGDDAFTRVIMGDISLIVSGNSLPFSFSLPIRSDVFVGRFELRSNKNRVSYSTIDYIFEVSNITECPVSVSSGPSPYILLTHTVTDITMYLDIGCSYIPPIACYFNDDHRVSASVSYDRAVCAAPTDIDAGEISLKIEVNLPGNVYNLTSPLTVVYYDMPSPSSVTPSVAHNTTTNITLCGLTYYDWSEPRCVFESTVYENASWINSTCIICRYYSSSPCGAHNLDDVAVSLYKEHKSIITLTLNNACLPKVSSSVLVMPQYVIISDTMTDTTLFINGIDIVNSLQMTCKFNDILTVGYYISPIVMQCTVPHTDTAAIVMLSISVDGQNFVNVSTFEFSYGGSLYCDAGHETVNSMCVPCKQSYYKDSAGTDECRVCGDNMITTTTGADNRTLCGCLRGYSAIVQNDVVYKCVECDDRVYCPGGHSPASTKPGYYIVNDVIVTCIPESACMSNSICAPGYHGPRCSSCESGYYRIDHECLECSRTSTSWRLPLLIAMAVFALSYLFKAALGGAKMSFKIVAITILYNFLQVFALIGSVPGQVNEPFKSTFQSLTAINLDVQLFAFECETFDMDFFQYYTVKLSTLPAAMVILWIIVMIVMVIRGYISISQSINDILSAGISTTILTTTLLYLALTSSVLSYVSCAVLEDGTWVLDASPDIECFGTEHLNNLWIFVIGMIVYVIGIPVVLYYIIVIKRKQLLNKNARDLPDIYKSRYGFLSMKYRAYVYWWELIVMARKALLVVAFTVWSKSILLKIEIAALVIFTSVFLQRGYKPLLDTGLNNMESVTLYINGLVLITGMGVFIGEYEQVSRTIALVIFGCVVILCFGVIVWIIACVYRHSDGDDDGDDDDMTDSDVIKGALTTEMNDIQIE